MLMLTVVDDLLINAANEERVRQVISDLQKSMKIKNTEEKGFTIRGGGTVVQDGSWTNYIGLHIYKFVDHYLFSQWHYVKDIERIDMRSFDEHGQLLPGKEPLRTGRGKNGKKARRSLYDYVRRALGKISYCWSLPHYNITYSTA